MSARNALSFVFSLAVIAGFTFGFQYVVGAEPMELWIRAQHKARELLSIESRYQLIYKKYFELQRSYFELEQRHNKLLAQVETRREVEENLRLTGARDGVSPEKITYKVPSKLAWEQKYHLAFNHMRENRFAEAAATFDGFLWSPEAAAFQDSRSYYEAGVAWFKVNNFKKSREAFVAAKKKIVGIEKVEMQRKIELWMKVLEHRKLASVSGKEK